MLTIAACIMRLECYSDYKSDSDDNLNLDVFKMLQVTRPLAKNHCEIRTLKDSDQSEMEKY